MWQRCRTTADIDENKETRKKHKAKQSKSKTGLKCWERERAQRIIKSKASCRHWINVDCNSREQQRRISGTSAARVLPPCLLYIHTLLSSDCDSHCSLQWIWGTYCFGCLPWRDKSNYGMPNPRLVAWVNAVESLAEQAQFGLLAVQRLHFHWRPICYHSIDFYFRSKPFWQWVVNQELCIICVFKLVFKLRFAVIRCTLIGRTATIL